MLKEAEHEKIMWLVDVYDDKSCIHLITDLCEGGELFEKIIKKKRSLTLVASRKVKRQESCTRSSVPYPIYTSAISTIETSSQKILSSR